MGLEVFFLMLFFNQTKMTSRLLFSHNFLLILRSAAAPASQIIYYLSVTATPCNTTDISTDRPGVIVITQTTEPSAAATCHGVLILLLVLFFNGLLV